MLTAVISKKRRNIVYLEQFENEKERKRYHLKHDNSSRKYENTCM